MGYQYTYLTMGIIFLVIWIILFVLNKYTRKEMIIISLFFTAAGPLSDILYTKDWWKPLTILKTQISIEALLVGFVLGGISSIIYMIIFNKKLKIKKPDKKTKIKRGLNLLLILSLLPILFFGSFYLLKINSLIATIIAFAIPTIIIYIRRRDLIKDSLASGLLLVMVAILVYSALEIITPGWIDNFWYFKNIKGIIFFNVPIDDIIWYFLAGAFIGPLYEYWQEGKIIDKKNLKK